TVLDEDVKWVNTNPAGEIARKQYAVGIPKAATYPVTIIVQWGGDTTNNAQKDAAGTAHYKALLREPAKGTPPQETFRIDLTSAATNAGSTLNKALRQTSSNVVTTELGLLPSPDLPTLTAGQGYRIFTFDSDETDFTFTAANTTGYGLFAAS